MSTQPPEGSADRVTALPVRTRSYAMFADLPGMAETRVLEFVTADDERQVTVVFDRELTPDEVLAVWERMTSLDDTDLADRAHIRAAVGLVEDLEPTPLTHLVLLLARRALSEQPE